MGRGAKNARAPLPTHAMPLPPLWPSVCELQVWRHRFGLCVELTTEAVQCRFFVIPCSFAIFMPESNRTLFLPSRKARAFFGSARVVATPEGCTAHEALAGDARCIHELMAAKLWAWRGWEATMVEARENRQDRALAHPA